MNGNVNNKEKLRDIKSMLIHFKEMPTGGSDINLKKAVEPVEGSLENILNLKPVTWKWRREEAGTGVQYGFIAQEVEVILPDLVSEEEWVDGTMRKFLASDKITPLLVGALQEQQKQIDDLREELKKFKK